MRFAVLFRGEAYRWGCSEPDAVGRQLSAIRSVLHHVVVPLERLGHEFAMLLPYSGPCIQYGENRSALVSLLKDAAKNGTGRRVVLRNISAPTPPKDQAITFQRALQYFRDVQSASAVLHWWQEGSQRFDTLIVTRFDLTFRTSVPTWLCDPTDGVTLSLASKCLQGKWHLWTCTNDLFYVVPSRYFGLFSSIIGFP